MEMSPPGEDVTTWRIRHHLEKTSPPGEDVTTWRRCHRLEKASPPGEGVTIWRRRHRLEKTSPPGEDVTAWRRRHRLEKTSPPGEDVTTWRRRHYLEKTSPPGEDGGLYHRDRVASLTQSQTHRPQTTTTMTRKKKPCSLCAPFLHVCMSANHCLTFSRRSPVHSVHPSSMSVCLPDVLKKKSCSLCAPFLHVCMPAGRSQEEVLFTLCTLPPCLYACRTFSRRSPVHSVHPSSMSVCLPDVLKKKSCSLCAPFLHVCMSANHCLTFSTSDQLVTNPPAASFRSAVGLLVRP